MRIYEDIRIHLNSCSCRDKFSAPLLLQDRRIPQNTVIAFPVLDFQCLILDVALCFRELDRKR